MATDAVKDEVKKASTEFLRLYRINQRWDIGLTVTAITFAILAGFVGALGNSSKLISEDIQKVMAGVLATLSAATQAGQSKFPVQERSRGYRNLKRKSSLLEIKSVTDTDESVIADLRKIWEDESDIP